MKTSQFFLAATAVLGATAGCSGSYVQAGSAVASDAALARGIETADSLIDAAIGMLIPGAVFLVAKDGRVVHERAFGYAQLNDYGGHRLATPTLVRT